MKAGFVRELLGRSDYAIIGEIVEPQTKVLDLGCGEGELLEWLASNKGVDARGVEISGAKVQKAIARGVSVFQCDIDEGLADYPDQAFDYVILSQTLQETRHPRKVLREMLRVGRRAIVAFPNFGHWRVRLSMLIPWNRWWWRFALPNGQRGTRPSPCARPPGSSQQSFDSSMDCFAWWARLRSKWRNLGIPPNVFARRSPVRLTSQ